MARIRTIKPAFFRHEELQDLEAAHPGSYVMLTFAGLWGHCDKQGVFLWKPRTLKLDILPFLSFDLDATLQILVRAGLVRHFEYGGLVYGYIPTFGDHQRVTGTEATEPALYPAPPTASTGQQPGSNQETARKHLGSQEGKGREEEGNGVQEGKKSVSAAPSRADAPPAPGVPAQADELDRPAADHPRRRDQARAVETAVVLEFPTVGKGGSRWALTEAQLAEWTGLYPNLDVLADMRNALAWVRAHHSHRKTADGMARFLVGWLNRTVNTGARARSVNGPTPNSAPAGDGALQRRQAWQDECRHHHAGACPNPTYHAARMESPS